MGSSLAPSRTTNRSFSAAWLVANAELKHVLRGSLGAQKQRSIPSKTSASENRYLGCVPVHALFTLSMYSLACFAALDRDSSKVAALSCGEGPQRSASPGSKGTHFFSAHHAEAQVHLFLHAADLPWDPQPAHRLDLPPLLKHVKIPELANLLLAGVLCAHHGLLQRHSTPAMCMLRTCWPMASESRMFSGWEATVHSDFICDFTPQRLRTAATFLGREYAQAQATPKVIDQSPRKRSTTQGLAMQS